MTWESATRRRFLGTTGGAIVGSTLFASTRAGGGRVTAYTDWPMFQVDSANEGHRPDGSGPTENISKGWEMSMGGAVTGTPVVTDGMVIAGSHAGIVRALSADDGSVEWVFQVDDTFSSSLALVGTTVVVPGEDALYALSTSDGTERWTVAADRDYSSPAVVDDTVYVTAGDRALALDATNGSERWRFELAYPARSGPAVAGGTLYTATSTIGDEHNYVYALDAENGTRRWRHDLGIYSSVNSAPTVADGVVYVGPSGPSQSTLTALAADGSGELWNTELPGDVDASVVVTDGTVYAPTISLDNAYLHAVDVGTGREQWRVEREVALAGRPARDSAPVLVGDTIYVGGYDETVKAISVESEDISWEFDVGNRVLASPAVVGGAVFIGAGDGNLYKLVPNETPTPTFSYEPTSPTVGTPVTFDASESTDDGGITTYEWDFDGDDEFEETGVRVEHTFTEPGNRTVHLRVTDAYGESDRTRTTVRVTAPETPTPTATDTPPSTSTTSPSTGTRVVTRGATDTPGGGAEPSSSFGGFLNRLITTLLSTESLVAMATGVVVVGLVVWWERTVNEND